MSDSNVFSKNLITLSLESSNKDDVINELADILVEAGRINNKEKFISDLFAREEIASTAFENGIAIPHTKSDSVNEASVVVGISNSGIDYGAENGEKSRIFFLIATPDNANDLHIKYLSKISSKLLDESFRKELLNANSKKEIYEMMMKKEEKIKESKMGDKFIIAVTGCPTGVAHTYMAAESLEKTAEQYGAVIKVETNGSVGVENSPTREEIEKADAVIVACDNTVDLKRFEGKKMVQTGVKKAVDRPEELIERALSGDCATYNCNKNSETSTNKIANTDELGNVYKYLMNGVSYMIPFVVVGGLMIALSLAIGGEPTPQGLQIPAGSQWNDILQVGVVGFNLMIPILAGYIAFAIGDRAALAPGMIGGWIANNGSFYGAEAGAGFIGAIIAGFFVGYLVKWIKSWKFPEMIRPLVPIMIIPILATTAVAGLFIFVIGAPISSLMASLVTMLESMSTGSIITIGIVIGLMQGFDMGGPFGKVAFMFSVGLIESGQTQFMGAQAAAIPVAPLGMALATFVGKGMNIFQKEELANGKAALAMGLVGISEGAIPFAASDPLAVIPANMIGSAVACVLGFLFGITNNVAHGGPIVAFLGTMNRPVMALAAMIIGAVVTAFITIIVKKYITRRKMSKA